MDALSLFLLVLAAAFLGGVIGGVIGYRMARLYYVALTRLMVRSALKSSAPPREKDAQP